ncbi:putative RNA-dependent RNA polymerase 2 [Talaromyces pinophilus]|nr:putative RNA-dependent RNA polymerase 2 [Talaromyces pinophilus]
MEVFLQNIPIDLNEVSLRDQLEPFMKKLNIRDYSCEKPRRKYFGNITFLHVQDGTRFLDAYGSNSLNSLPGKLTMSRLRFLGADIVCHLSKRAPQEFTLKSLTHTAEQRNSSSHVVIEDHHSVSLPMLSSSCGYCTFVNGNLVYVPEVRWDDGGNVLFSKKNMIVKMNSGNSLQISLNAVVELVWSTDGSLTVTLSNAPVFLYRPPHIDRLLKQMFVITLNSRSDFQEQIRARLCALGDRHAEVVGHCLVYQFKVQPESLINNIAKIEECEMTMIQYELLPYQKLQQTLAPYSSQLQILKSELAACTQNKSLPFEVLFQLQALAYNAYLLPVTVAALTKELQTLSRRYKAAGQKPLLAESLRKLFETIDWPLPHGHAENFEVASLVNNIETARNELRQRPLQINGMFESTRNLARIFRVVVTPTSITLRGPEMEPKNRILRRFPNHTEFFIRVQFCDEDGQDMHFNFRVDNEKVFHRFKSIFKKGIEIAGRTYGFLGFSHSSLRSHSAWFSAPFVDDNGTFQTYFSIIKALGDFSHITSPARCAARIGQAFSETPFAISLEDNNVRVTEIPDVKSPDGSRVFSDGVGTISRSVMEALWVNLPSEKGRPTCFQIRLGGAKGMLALDPRLTGSVICLRPSMVKFPSNAMQDLEICDVASRPIPLVLNRQVIKIMEDMGVPVDWFFKLQKRCLSDLQAATSTTEAAARFIKRHDVAPALRLHRLLQQCDTIGMDYRQEPFITSVVGAVALSELRLLKYKARIPVSKGITLYGIMDETNFLQSEQVYITYDTLGDRFELPPPGPVLVTRSPALCNGDIQIAYNCPPPASHPLRQLRNCIVFSQLGQRDLPSQLSGGDLDGDMYNIIWDEEAIPQTTFGPADYPNVQPIDIGRPVGKDDIADFFVDFMKTDCLGVIATRHMIIADQEMLGTSHPNCKKLAQLHSAAVDFSKTGNPVNIKDLPWANPHRPDFLAPGPQTKLRNRAEIDLEKYIIQPKEDEIMRPVYKYYKSDKLLGHLYRAIDEQQIWKQSIRPIRIAATTSFWPRFIHGVITKCNIRGPIRWRDHRDTARRLRVVYEEAVFSAMSNFSEHPVKPISELEVFIGCILNKTGVQTRRQRERSIRLKDEFDRITAFIMAQIRPHGNTIVPLTGYESEMDALELCLACVHIAGERSSFASERYRHDESVELGSFQIVAACALLAEAEMFEQGKKGSGL